MPVFSYTRIRSETEGVRLFIPDPADVERQYRESTENGSVGTFPFWTRLWPSSLALARFIKKHRTICEGRSVLEIGAGLGLPSFVAADQARMVTVTDHIPESIAWMNLNIEVLGLKNITAKVLDWKDHMHEDAEVILLSDISYDPENFDLLLEMIRSFLEKGSKMIIAIPDRIISGQFYGLIEKYVSKAETFNIDERLVLVACLDS